jgi:hypothetical protein
MWKVENSGVPPENVPSISHVPVVGVAAKAAVLAALMHAAANKVTQLDFCMDHVLCLLKVKEV